MMRSVCACTLCIWAYAHKHIHIQYTPFSWCFAQNMTDQFTHSIQYVCSLVIMLDWHFVENLEAKMIRTMYTVDLFFSLFSTKVWVSLAKYIQKIRINFMFRLATKCIGTYIGLHTSHNLVFTPHTVAKMKTFMLFTWLTAFETS